MSRRKATVDTVKMRELMDRIGYNVKGSEFPSVVRKDDLEISWEDASSYLLNEIGKDFRASKSALIKTGRLIAEFRRTVEFSFALIEDDRFFQYANAKSILKQIMEDLATIVSMRNQAIVEADYSFAAVKSSLPSSAPAPVRVAVHAGKLDLVTLKHHVGTISNPSVDRLRISVHKILSRVLLELGHATNADPRLAPSLEGLLEELSLDYEDFSIEAIGLNWRVAQETLHATEETVPTPLLAQIKQVLTTVNVILVQYDDWQAYLAAEAGSSIKAEEVQQLAVETQHFAAVLADSPDVVEPKIVDRLTNITDAIAVGLVQADSLGAGLVGSLSNLLAAFSQVALDAIPAMAASGEIGGAIALTTLSLKIIKLFAPSFAKYGPLSWIYDVHEELLKYAPELTEAAKFVIKSFRS